MLELKIQPCFEFWEKLVHKLEQLDHSETYILVALVHKYGIITPVSISVLKHGPDTDHVRPSAPNKYFLLAPKLKPRVTWGALITWHTRSDIAVCYLSCFPNRHTEKNLSTALTSLNGKYPMAPNITRRGSMIWHAN